MKRLICVLLVFFIALSFTGCFGNGSCWYYTAQESEIHFKIYEEKLKDIAQKNGFAFSDEISLSYEKDNEYYTDNQNEFSVAEILESDDKEIKKYRCEFYLQKGKQTIQIGMCNSLSDDFGDESQKCDVEGLSVSYKKPENEKFNKHLFLEIVKTISYNKLTEKRIDRLLSDDSKRFNNEMDRQENELIRRTDDMASIDLPSLSYILYNDGYDKLVFGTYVLPLD